MAKLLRISTVSHSLDLLLKGQLKFAGENGYEVHIACTKDHRVVEIERRENVKFHNLELTRTISPFSDLLSLFKAIILIYRLKPDIVHTHSPKAGIIGMLASSICGVPLKIHTVAGLPLVESRGLKRRLLINIERLTYFFSDFVLPNSIQQKLYIEENIMKNEKIQVIGRGSTNGIDLNFFNPDIFTSKEIDAIKDNYKITNSNIVLCFVGRLASSKGINELVGVFRQLNQEFNNLKLLMVGPYEPLEPLDRLTLKEISENRNIISVGHQDDIRPFLIISDLFVFPSYREGFPQSLMQASAMKLACIATDINGCNEIITNSLNGILVPPRDKQELYKSIRELIVDNGKRKQFSQKARENMELNYSQKEFWLKILNFYSSKLNGKK